MIPDIVTITYLEMLSPADLKPKRCADAEFWIKEATIKQWQLNRFLYCLVGGNWSWTDKLSWTEGRWRQYVSSDRLKTFAAFHGGAVAGYYELRTHEREGVEIAILGLAPEFIGQGYGGVLLTHALEQTWHSGAQRVWLHTCTLDHPAALPNYLARGMRVYKTETIRRQ